MRLLLLFPKAPRENGFDPVDLHRHIGRGKPGDVGDGSGIKKCS